MLTVSAALRAARCAAHQHTGGGRTTVHGNAGSKTGCGNSCASARHQNTAGSATRRVKHRCAFTRNNSADPAPFPCERIPRVPESYVVAVDIVCAHPLAQASVSTLFESPKVHMLDIKEERKPCVQRTHLRTHSATGPSQATRTPASTANAWGRTGQVSLEQRWRLVSQCPDR